MSEKIKEINKLCIKCTHKCKQSVEIHLLGCPHFEMKPQQLEIRFSFSGKANK